MKRKKIIRILLGVFVLIVFVLPAVGFGVLKWVVLPPEKLTPLVVGAVNKLINGELKCKSIELTYFETYPHLGLQLDKGTILVPDTLLAFDRATVVLNPMDYLTRGTLTIRRIALDRPCIHGSIDGNGKANWEIYETENDTTKQESDSSLPPIDLQQVLIQEGKFTYCDSTQQLYAAVDGFFLRLTGSLLEGENRIAIETGSRSIRFDSPSYQLSNHLAWYFKSRLKLADGYRKVTLDGAELTLNEIPFRADGTLSANDSTQRITMDLNVGLEVEDLNDLLGFVPDVYFKNRENTSARGKIILEGRLSGELGDSIVPTIDLCCRVDEGSYRVKGVNQGIDTLRMDLDLHLNGPSPDSSYVNLNQLRVVGPNVTWEMQADVHDLFRNPAIRTLLRGTINFTKLGAAFLNPDTLLLEGSMDADLRAAFTLNDLLESRFGKIQAKGNLDVDHFKAFSKPLGINMYLNGTRLAIAEVEEESTYMQAKGLIRANLQIDTLNLLYGKEIDTNISQLALTANTARVIDTTAIIPLTLRLEYEKLRTRLPDSTWVATGHTLLRGGIKASGSNKKIPMLGASIEVDTFKYIVIPLRTGIVLAGSTFNLEALPWRDAIRQRIIQRGIQSRRQLRRMPADSLQRLATQDTTESTTRFLRRWEARGNIHFKQLRGFSRLFPIPFRMDQTVLDYTTNNITLKDARLHLGKSDLTLNGEVSHIRQALLRGGKLKGNFSLRSDYLDCNQLMLAMNNGMKFVDQLGGSEEDSFDEDSLALHADRVMIADTLHVDTTSQLFLVPDFLDLTFHADARRIDFKDLQLKEVEGEVVIRDQSINLSELKMDSNIGSGNLTMAYTTRDRSGATIGFDLDMHQILVDRLINLFPSIDTLVPMLRSFEGVVNCQMTTTCRTDSTMSVLLPSVNASCFLSGRNMVLLDGETFAEISKTLMFKNKKRNLIDSIAVDLAVKDNKIEVFPFLVEMDRYKAAVGGTQNLDMNFNYHISVLKSPVPFKLGIDIYGNMDDFKFKITKCKYKDFLEPAKQMELDSTRRNVRRDIREAVRKQIREAAPELAGSLPPVALNP